MRTIKHFTYILLLLLIANAAYAQDNLQAIFQPVFTNPSFNSYNDCMSIDLLVRNQWGSEVVGNPEVYAAHLYFPIDIVLGGGVALEILDENQGLSDRLTMMAIFSHHVRLTTNSYLGFGYGFGFDRFTYDWAAIEEYNPGIIYSHQDVLHDTNAKVTAGLTFVSPNFYTGLSFHATLNTEYNKNFMFRDVDWNAGYFYHINDDVVLKPEVAVKYYRMQEYKYVGTDESEGWVDPIFNVGVNVLLKNRIWLGIAQRFKYAQLYTASFYINKTIRLGYTFERGIGSGINQFDSHMFVLTWNFKKGKLFKKGDYAVDKDAFGQETFVPEARHLMYW